MVTEQALDPRQAQEALYDLADAPDALTPAALRALAERMEGGQATPAAPTQSSPAEPPAAGGPPTIEALRQQLPDVRRRMVEATRQGDHPAARDAVWEFADSLNQVMDREAQERAPHLYGEPEQPLDLGDLQQRLRAAAVDPAAVGEQGIHKLADEFNRAVARISVEAERDEETFARQVRAQQATTSSSTGGNR